MALVHMLATCWFLDLRQRCQYTSNLVSKSFQMLLPSWNSYNECEKAKPPGVCDAILRRTIISSRYLYLMIKCSPSSWIQQKNKPLKLQDKCFCNRVFITYPTPCGHLFIRFILHGNILLNSHSTFAQGKAFSVLLSRTFNASSHVPTMSRNLEIGPQPSIRVPRVFFLFHQVPGRSKTLSIV